MPNRPGHYRIDLSTLAGRTFSDIFGDEILKEDEARDKIWGFVFKHGCVKENPSDHDGDDLGWLMPIEIPVLSPDEEMRIRRQFDPLGKGSLTFDDMYDPFRVRVSFSTVGDVTLGEVFGGRLMAESDFMNAFSGFIKSRGLKDGTMTDAQLALLRAVPHRTCSRCQALVKRNYCRQCDEVFDEAHAAGCPLPNEPGPDGDNHRGHRTY
ncbi:MAG: hypothetical protein AAB554_01730 [Patescibacteria group bacterium]